MDPLHLMNLTRKFEGQLKKQNGALVDLFIERPAGEQQPSGLPPQNAN